MTRKDLVGLGGAAGVLGALAWVVKGAVILATGLQPPFLFEVAPGFLAVGLIALFLRLETRSRLGTAGPVLVIIALAAWTVSILASADNGAFSAAVLISTLGLLVGLIVLCVPCAATQASVPARCPRCRCGSASGCSPHWPWVARLEAIDDRLLEMPLVVVGSLWPTSVS